MFLSAFLVFQVQPVISKFILPWYGGSASVWTVCMLFFQVCLLLGYLYAHVLTRIPSVKLQVAVHGVLLAASLALLPIVPSDSWKPTASAEPVLGILGLLGSSLGLPFLVLSATSPLVQRWFVALRPGVSPYRFYALSNVGSLLALLTYPFIVEPNLTRKVQADAWSWGMGAFAILLAACLVILVRSAQKAAKGGPPEKDDQQGRERRWLWVALPAAASILLLASTNKLCQEIAVIPLLWVVPLALYLVTFIISFDSPRWYSRPVFMGAWALSLGFVAWVLLKGWDAPLAGVLAAYPACVFTGCMICHGELVRLKPPASRLTLYYLWIAFGGALGSLFVALVSPVIFDDYSEFYVGLLAVTALLLAVLFTDGRSPLRRGRPVWAWALFSLGTCALAGVCLQARISSHENAIATVRNFYGSLSVTEHASEEPRYSFRAMRHGGILHGLQFMNDTFKIYPTTYYGANSGIGKLFRYYPREKPIRVGLVGLGTGTLAVWALPGDEFRIYEINPEVRRLAGEYFSYLRDCRGSKEYVIGDARLSLEHEQPQGFDILVVDAFNSDSPPLHLLTREAFRLYSTHLKPGGVLALHITCRHIDFFPVLASLADDLKMRYRLIVDPNKNHDPFANPSRWMLLTDTGDFLDHPAIRPYTVTRNYDRPVPFWTDEYTSILPVLLW
jgi:hypothetical protein